jgi:hypothetical protein
MGYRPHATAEAAWIDVQVADFLKDLDARIADLVRRQPRKRLA